MVRFTFRQGLQFIAGLCIWTLTRRTATNKLVFQNETTDEHEVLADTEVYERWEDGRWLVKESSIGAGRSLVYQSTPQDMQSLPERYRAGAERKLDYVRQVQLAFEKDGLPVKCDVVRLDNEIAKVAEVRSDPEPPEWSTWWRWWRRFSATKCVSKLVDRRRHNQRRRIPEALSIFEEVISEVFLTRQKNPAKAVVDGVKERYARMNKSLEAKDHLKAPSPATIYRWLNALNYRVVLQAREGKKLSDRELRAAIGSVKVSRILERVEIDHTPVDLLVVCETTRMVLGRPWLTLAIDRRSRMICGFYIGFHAPSASSVLYCLRMAILPKSSVLKGIEGLKNPWTVRGMPASVVADNGMDLHAKSLETFCLEGLIELIYCGAAHPELKGAIERMFRTLSADLFHSLPGTVFSNVIDRADYQSEKQAAIDLKTLTRILIKWIVDVYHCTPHRGLNGKTPLQVWQEDEMAMSFELPAYPRQFDLMVGHSATRTLFHYGVEYDCINYNSALLQTFGDLHEKRQVLELRVYDHDVSYIDVLDAKTDEFVRVPAVDQDYCAGLNRETHAMVRQLVRSRFKDEWTQQQLRDAKAEIQTMVAEALRAHKAGKRKERAAKRMHDSEEVLGTRPTPSLDAAQQPSAVDLENAEDGELHDVLDHLPQFGTAVRQGSVA